MNSKIKLESRIEIAGGIASGKTTLGHLLAKDDVPPIIEDFRSNPFWTKFYANPQKYAFETEITFHLQHYSQFRDAENLEGFVFCDTSLLLDLAYADLNLSGSKYDAFFRVYQEAVKSLSPPKAIVHLECSAEEELRRVRQRARQEETSMTIEYLQGLNRSLGSRIEEASNHTKIITVDSQKYNFARNEDDKKAVRRAVLSELID